MAPNIIYIVAHDTGRHLGAYGAGVSTPNLDRFGAEGAIFTRAVTNSVACSPSRGCAMSGMYAHTNGLMGLVNCGWSMPESTPTIVVHLAAAGYETANFGMQHERWSAAANRYEVQGRQEQSELYVERAVANSIRFLEERPRDRPFYLNMATFENHPSQWQSRTGKARLDLYKPGRPEDAFVPEEIPDLPQFRVEMAHLQACVEYY